MKGWWDVLMKGWWDTLAPPVTHHPSLELHSPAAPPAPYTRMYKTIVVVVCYLLRVTVLSYCTMKETS